MGDTFDVNHALALSQNYTRARSEDQELERIRLDAPPRLEVAGGFKERTIDLATLPTTGQGLGLQGTGLLYRRENSHPGGRITVVVGTEVHDLYPGCVLRGKFDKLWLYRSSRSVTSGDARLIVLTDPSVDLVEPATLTVVGFRQPKGDGTNIGVGPNGLFEQVIGSAAGNVPVAATDGMDLTDLRGLRVILSAGVGETLSGAGTLRFWQNSASRGRWVRSQDVKLAVTDSGVRDIIYPDMEVLVPEGRVYVEAVSVTATGTALVVTLEGWG